VKHKVAMPERGLLNGLARFGVSRRLLVVMGLALAGIGAWSTWNHAPGSNGPAARPSASADVRIDADTSGAIRDWLLAIPDAFAETFVDTQAALIARSDASVRFHVVHSSARGRSLLLERLDPASARRVTFHVRKQSVSPWVRDYYLQARARDGSQVALLHNPEHYRGAGGPWQSLDPTDFVAAVPGLKATPTTLRVDGGDVVADDERVFAARAPIDAASACGELGCPGQFERGVEERWGRPVTWIPTAHATPSGHADIVLMPAGNHAVAMGNVALAVSLLERVSAQDKARFIERFRTFTREPPDPQAAPIEHDRIFEQLAADSRIPQRLAELATIERQLGDLTYKAVRVPYLTLDPVRYGLYLTITYTNVVFDVRGDHKTVYVPVYGLGALDDAATRAWRELGYEVVPIDALGPAIHGGALRCLSQVTRSSPAGADVGSAAKIDG